jgi:sec-independent protein translocase protein TatA
MQNSRYNPDMTTATAPMLAAFGLPGGAELIIILVIGLLLFGSRLPSVGRNIGKSITEFKKGMKEAGEELTKDKDEPQAAAQRPQLSQEQMERATDEALRRLRAEQAATQAATQK